MATKSPYPDPEPELDFAADAQSFTFALQNFEKFKLREGAGRISPEYKAAREALRKASKRLSASFIWTHAKKDQAPGF